MHTYQSDFNFGDLKRFEKILKVNIYTKALIQF